MNRAIDDETAESRWNWLYKASGMAALIVGLLLFVGLAGLVTPDLDSSSIARWLSPLQNNWLVILLKLNAALHGVQFDLLYGLNPLDLVIMALVIVMHLGLYAALRWSSRVWSMIAAVVPVLGMLLLFVTRIAGRSGVMVAGLIISLVMLRSNVFAKTIAFVGILASSHLLLGDFGTGANSHSIVVAILMGIGYVLLTIWYFLIGRKLLKLKQ
jgi:lysylphosphatidylglycerol synthetase-like protein (DUF2156 family)